MVAMMAQFFVLLREGQSSVAADPAVLCCAMRLLCCCRCAQTGVRVFRMWRDDAYLRTMLQLLQVLQTECVIPQIQPRADIYSTVPGYKAFLHRTSAIARSAVCVAEGNEEMVARVPEAADGSNVSKFW